MKRTALIAVALVFCASTAFALDGGINLMTKLFNGSESEGWGLLFDSHVGFTLSFGSES